jgi:hypothetical protein
MIVVDHRLCAIYRWRRFVTLVAHVHSLPFPLRLDTHQTKAKKYAADAKVKAERTKAEAKVGALPEVPSFALILLLKTRFVGRFRPRLDKCMAFQAWS